MQNPFTTAVPLSTHESHNRKLPPPKLVENPFTSPFKDISKPDPSTITRTNPFLEPKITPHVENSPYQPKKEIPLPNKNNPFLNTLDSKLSHSTLKTNLPRDDGNDFLERAKRALNIARPLKNSSISDFLVSKSAEEHFKSPTNTRKPPPPKCSRVKKTKCNENVIETNFPVYETEDPFSKLRDAKSDSNNDPLLQTVPLFGNTYAQERIDQWFVEYGRRNPKIHRALLVYGASGTGKATAVRNSMIKAGYTVHEFNSLDRREPTDLEICKSLISGSPLDDHPAAVLMLDVERLSVAKQNVSIEFLKNMISPWRNRKTVSKKWQAPIVCISSQRDSPALHGLAAFCDLVEFVPLQPMEIQLLIDTTGLELESDLKQQLIEKSRGNAVLLLTMLELLKIDQQCGAPMGSVSTADTFDSVHLSIFNLLREPNFDNASLAHNNAVSLTPQLLHENLPLHNDLETLVDVLNWQSWGDVVEEQALVSIRPELRDAHTVMAVWAPAALNKAQIDTLQYPEMRSHQTRLRTAKIKQRALKQALGGDVVFRNEAAEFIANRLLHQNSAQNLQFVTGLGMHWPETDYCLSRKVDFQNRFKTKTKNRGIPRTTLATLRRGIEEFWEEKDRLICNKYDL